jgi:hypothetical protein
MIASSPVFMSEKSTMFVTIVGLHRIEKFFPSVNLTFEGQVSFLVPMRNPVHFLAVNLGITSPQFFVLLLDSLVQTPVFLR